MRQITKIELVEEFPIYDITVEDDHCFELYNGVVAHNSMYPKEIMAGGRGLYYSANNIFFITRSQEKEGTEVVGYNFTINIEKSRFVKEKSKLKFLVTYDGGISKYSGLLDLALEFGFVKKPSNGWYSRVDTKTGVIEDKKYRESETLNKAFWIPVLTNADFYEQVKNKYQLAIAPIQQLED